jgi:hypothetical protein
MKRSTSGTVIVAGLIALGSLAITPTVAVALPKEECIEGNQKIPGNGEVYDCVGGRWVKNHERSRGRTAPGGGGPADGGTSNPGPSNPPARDRAPRGNLY